jgi:hypothetical protein
MINPNASYIGIIWEGIDLQLQLKYPVYIRELSPVGSLNIFWVTNEVESSTFLRWMDPSLPTTEPSGKKSAGSYFPLHYGMPVEVKFRNTNQNSGYISKLINNNGYVPTEHSKKDLFYLLCKTVNDSYIYLDDERETIHIMNSKGKSNILHTGELLNDGSDGVGTAKSNTIVEASKTSIDLKFNNNFITVDDTGITFSVGEKSRSYLKITESGIKFGSAGDIQVRSDKNLNLEGNHTYLQGDAELDIYSNNTRMSGSQLLNLTSNVINIEGFTDTHIKGNHILLDALMKLKLNGLMIDINAFSTLFMNSLLQVVNSQVISNTAPTISNVGSVIFNDGMIMNNMNLGTGISNSLKASTMAASIGTEAAAASMVTALTVSNDPISGLSSMFLNSVLPGSAQPANGQLDMPIIINKTNLGCSPAVSYINGYNTKGNANILSPLPLPITI